MSAKACLLLVLLLSQFLACSVRPGSGVQGGNDVVQLLWAEHSPSVLPADSGPCAKVVALLIGISQYNAASGWEVLNAQNDVALMTATLLKHGVKRGNIHTLTDQQATKAGIERALKTLADTLQQGNQLIVLYAGHARQLPDDNGDETDGYDEALVPYDAPPVSQNQPDGYLRDDELNRHFTQIRATLGPTGSLWLLFDACHSQTLNRGNPVERRHGGGNPAGMQSSIKQMTSHVRGGVEPLGEPARRSIRRAAASGSDWYETPSATGSLAPYVLFAATTDGGPNFETTDASGQSLGPLTRAVGEVWDNESRVTYRDLFTRVAAAMARFAPYQRPGLEGNADLPAPGCGSVKAASTWLYSTTGERLRVAWPRNDADLTKRLSDLPFVQIAATHPDLRIDRRNRGYQLWSATQQTNPLAQNLSFADCAERIRQYFARTVLLQLHQTTPDFGVRVTMQRVAVQTKQGHTVVTDSLPNLTATGLPVFSTAPNERALLTLTNTGPKTAYLTVIDLLPDGTLHVLLPGDGEPATAYRLLPGQSLQRRIRLKEPTGAEVYKILLTPDPIDLRTVLQTRGNAPAQHPYELLFQRTYTTRGMPQTAPLSLSEQTGATDEVVFWVKN
ncbi:caspase family protein [Spirosoma spitsbergense]|uniref:caspase family protein n=1 Tax=Spirosoma spitsbergense TaxID=431554 RepID=UPI00036332EC|nr:caspase family protein [Spirosoma spitsbergense]